MLDVHDLQTSDLRELSPEALAMAAEQMLSHIASQAQAIRWRDAKIECLAFELARLKAWKFAARTERMSAEQRELFEETAAADEASLQAQLEGLQGQGGAMTTTPPDAKRRPRRQPLAEHLPRVEHRHEPECTSCECGRAMLRIGEDVSERLDVVPAQFFVHRHIRGKWACRACQRLVQEPVEPQIIDGGMPAPGLVAHTLTCSTPARERQ